eukprot:jgi/Ulvmu1/9789/UM056_0029.1
MLGDEVSVPLNSAGDAIHEAVEQDNWHHHPEDHVSQRAPWLRAAVLGASDGLVTVGALVTGIATSQASQHQLLLSALAGMISGSLSMALGEYVSVSQQADSERADVETERRAQQAGPIVRAQELQELVEIYIGRGLPEELAREVAEKLTEKDAIRAHARDELGIDIDDHPDPWQAAGASMASFVAGSGIPTLALLLPDPHFRLWGLVITVTIGLIVFGGAAAALGGISPLRGASRVLIGGWLAMALTAVVGHLFGTEPA